MAEFIQFMEMKKNGESVMLAEFRSEEAAKNFMDSMQNTNRGDIYYLQNVFHSDIGGADTLH
jgi:hypothetical protein